MKGVGELEENRQFSPDLSNINDDSTDHSKIEGK